MREFKDSITRKADDDDEDGDSGAASRSEATAALGRPEGETTTQPASDGAVSEKTH